MNKLALAMICKGDKKELKKLSDCLKSASKYVDGIFVFVNAKDPSKIPVADFGKVAEKYSAHFDYGTWNGHFGEARQASFDLVGDDYDFILWLDADDKLVSGDQIAEVLSKMPRGANGLYAKYEYDIDEYGNVVTEHTVARIVRNNDSFKWSNKLVHETLEPVRRVESVSTDSFWVRHNNSEEDKDASLVRNIELLEREIEGEGASPDARTLFYLANHYVDARRTQEAKELFTKYIELSGWDEERAQASIQLGRIAHAEGRKKDAVRHFLDAVADFEKSPQPYYELGIFYLQEDQLQKAIYWLEWCVVQKQRMNTIASNPLINTYFSFIGLAEANFRLGGKNIDQALKWATEALKIRKDEVTVQLVQEIRRVVSLSKRLESFIEAFKEGDDVEKKELLNKVPRSLQDNPVIIDMQNKYLDPVEWPDKSICFYIGNSTIGEWGPWSLEDGVGGSEEAVIRISRQFKDMGWDVTIFGTPGSQAGDYGGVHWRNYWEYKRNDKHNVLVVWRSPEFFERDLGAKRAYLWMHDVDNDEEFTKERLGRIDKVMVLSQYHRTCFPSIPEDKILYTANGIDAAESIDNDDVEREPQTAIYTSSHVRGLERLYDIWPDVLKEVPNAKLNVYYGWHSYDKITGDNPERKAWKEMMIRKASELEGVTDNGKVGQDVIAEETARAGVWAYPTAFPEISCITAMKCQAGGAIPVCSDYAALEETVQHGVKMQLDDIWTDKQKKAYTEALIDMLKDEDKQNKIRTKMMPWARENFSWKKVAEQWSDAFTS